VTANFDGGAGDKSGLLTADSDPKHAGERRAEKIIAPPTKPIQVVVPLAKRR
jgi:hypothetical protein